MDTVQREPLRDKIRYGEVEAAGFTLFEFGYPPSFTIPSHTHNNAQFCFVLEGSLTEALDRTVLHCHRFDLSFKPAGVLHQVESGPAGARVLVVSIPGDRLLASRTLAETLSLPIRIGHGALAGLGLRMYAELKTSDPFARLAIEGTVLELLASASRRIRSDGVGLRNDFLWLEEVAALVRERLTERLTLADLARTAGVTPRRLAREFRMHYRCSVEAYLRELRVRLAAEALSASDRPIAEIALGIGFCDQSHLNRVFKRHMGMTPAAYRWSTRRS